MKDFALKIVNNPGVRKAFWALVIAVLTAAGYSQLGGCTPAQLERADAVHEKLDCLDAALRRYDVLTHPEQTTVEDAAALSLELKRCLKPAASAADAGAR